MADIWILHLLVQLVFVGSCPDHPKGCRDNEIRSYVTGSDEAEIAFPI
jgi:hypothetical protein